MKELIQAKLREIEASEGVKILYACESGSRAWGFPSADSDYDVRFLYIRSVEVYLSIEPGRDVIELEIDKGLDISGWDLKKALLLFRRSNPPLFEWLGSSIFYAEPFSAASKMRELSSLYYSPAACLHHYLHMARGNFREYLKGEEVWIKKYFYVLRPILAMQWIEQELGVVPTDFNVLVSHLPLGRDLREAIDQLLTAKRAGEELDRGPRIEPISRFIETELERLGNRTIPDHQRVEDNHLLDKLFRETLQEVWHS